MRTVLNLNNKIEELQDTELELRKEIDTLNSQLDEIRVESNIFTKRSQNVSGSVVMCEGCLAYIQCRNQAMLSPRILTLLQRLKPPYQQEIRDMKQLLNSEKSKAEALAEENKKLRNENIDLSDKVEVLNANPGYAAGLQNSGGKQGGGATDKQSKKIMEDMAMRLQEHEVSKGGDTSSSWILEFS